MAHLHTTGTAQVKRNFFPTAARLQKISEYGLVHFYRNETMIFPLLWRMLLLVIIMLYLTISPAPQQLQFRIASLNKISKVLSSCYGWLVPRREKDSRLERSANYLRIYFCVGRGVLLPPLLAERSSIKACWYILASRKGTKGEKDCYSGN